MRFLVHIALLKKIFIYFFASIIFTTMRQIVFQLLHDAPELMALALPMKLQAGELVGRPRRAGEVGQEAARERGLSHEAESKTLSCPCRVGTSGGGANEMESRNRVTSPLG